MHAGDLGDHLGMESCIDLDTDIYTAVCSGDAADRKPWRLNNNNKRKPSMSVKNVKGLPPPLPLQTGLKRYYTHDGRLIIAEEKIECPKCHFTAVRSNGRLTLQVVRSESSCDAEIGGGETGIIEEGRGGKLTEDSNGDGEGNGGGVGKGFKYNGAVRVASAGPCLLVEQNQLHAIKPVQI